MELITIESKAFKQLEEKLTIIADYVLRNMKEEETDGLVDSYEVCTYLKISRRTLQRLRAKGVINYSKAGRKHLYELNEVKRMIEENLVGSNPENFVDLVNNHKIYLRKRLLVKSSNDNK